MRRLLIPLIWGASLAGAIAIDRPLASYVAEHPFGYSFELYAMFRLSGFLPLWMVVSIALVLVDSEKGWRDAWRRGTLLFAAAAASGAVAELLKMLVRRERPSAVAEFVFRPWTESPFATSGLGWPSSHTAVAFGAAWLLCWYYPRAAAVWLGIAVACAFSRLANNAHFASDLVGAALVGYLVTAALRRYRTLPPA